MSKKYWNFKKYELEYANTGSEYTDLFTNLSIEDSESMICIENK